MSTPSAFAEATADHRNFGEGGRVIVPHREFHVVPFIIPSERRGNAG